MDCTGMKRDISCLREAHGEVQENRSDIGS